MCNISDVRTQTGTFSQTLERQPVPARTHIYPPGYYFFKKKKLSCAATLSLRAPRLPFLLLQGFGEETTSAIAPHVSSCFAAARRRCSSGFEAHPSHQLLVDSPSHSRHQGAAQRPRDGPAEKPHGAVLLREKTDQEGDQHTGAETKDHQRAVTGRAHTV